VVGQFGPRGQSALTRGSLYFRQCLGTRVSTGPFIPIKVG
jgi:hypothetical protein